VLRVRSWASCCYDRGRSNYTRDDETSRRLRSCDDETVVSESNCRRAVELGMCVIILGMIRVLDGRMLGTVAVLTTRPHVMTRLCARM
jgi:hypothetical protein